MAKKKAAKKAKATAATSKGAAAPSDYVVYARRFRPQSFNDVVGQSTVTSALCHALKKGRLAQAYLLCGPRGVGKTSLARIFAKALNCLEGDGPGGVAAEPCNTCDACLSIGEGSALDVIEMDAATNRGINEIRELRENVGLAPSQLRYKVYIVDEVHMLTNEAWNAFLKTLEEPPAHVKFIFATTDPDRIPETILSRCQRFDLRRIGLKDIVLRLQQICDEEKVKADLSALERIAGLAKGGLRDAESMLDQAVNLGEGNVSDEVVRDISGAAPDELIFELLHACADGQVGEALTKAGEAIENGADPDDLLISLSERLRGTLLCKTCGTETSLLEGQTHLAKPYSELGEKLSEDQVLMLLQLFTAARRQVRDAAQARLPLEMAIVRAARAHELVDLGKLVSALESGGGAAAAARGGGARGAPRPNSESRPAAPVEARPAARTNAGPAARKNASATPMATTVAPVSLSEPSEDRPERWDDLLAAVRPKSGGALIAAQLAHAAEVALDLEGGTLTLGFTPAQGFYKESLLKRTDALQEALSEVYGRTLELAFAQSSAQPKPRVVSPRPAAPVRAPDDDYLDEGALPLQPTARPEPDADLDEAAYGTDDEGEEDLGPGGASPRRPSALDVDQVVERASAQGQTEGEGVVDGAIPAASNEHLVSGDPSEVLEHPLVKSVLEQSDGKVVRVLKRARRDEADAGKASDG